MKELVLIVGKPGAGKDTQLEILKQIKKIEIIKVGDLVRDKAKNNKKISSILDNGGLVQNSLVDKIVADKILSFQDNSTIIADGFPRDLPQAEWLDGFAKANAVKISKLVFIDIPYKESVDRLLKRGRSDDNEKTISNRINIFNQRTMKVIDYYANQGILQKVDGVGRIGEVHERIKKALEW